MVHTLTPHPAHPCFVLARLDVSARRPAPDRLALRYRLSGAGPGLVLPPVMGGRADGLWRHTCLEAFVRLPGDDAYRELNLSPGGQWAAYRFDAYREGMADAAIGPPETALGAGGGEALQFEAAWTLDLPADPVWRIAVTAVIEAADGALSYWSLRHPPGRPDFHHPDGFVLELPPISAA